MQRSPIERQCRLQTLAVSADRRLQTDHRCLYGADRSVRPAQKVDGCSAPTDTVAIDGMAQPACVLRFRVRCSRIFPGTLGRDTGVEKCGLHELTDLTSYARHWSLINLLQSIPFPDLTTDRYNYSPFLSVSVRRQSSRSLDHGRLIGSMAIIAGKDG